jgi:hypothetical protein
MFGENAPNDLAIPRLPAKTGSRIFEIEIKIELEEE